MTHVHVVMAYYNDGGGIIAVYGDPGDAATRAEQEQRRTYDVIAVEKMEVL